MKPYPVKISPELIDQIYDVLSSLNITPISIKSIEVIFSSYQYFSGYIYDSFYNANLYYRNHLNKKINLLMAFLY